MIGCNVNTTLPVRFHVNEVVCHVNVSRRHPNGMCHAINIKYVENRWDNAGDNDKKPNVSGEGLF